MEKEIAKNAIEKASVKGDKCEVIFTEKYTKANFSNEVNKKCNQIVHPDLKKAFDMLRPFLITITEQPEENLFNIGNIDEPLTEELENKIIKYIVTGYSHGGSGESEGVTLIGQKILKSGQVLNLIAPFTRFNDETPDSYSYGAELSQAIARCDWEVSEYLFSEKWGFKQEQLDFETDAPIEASDKIKGKKESKKNRKQNVKKTVVFDQTA